VFKISSTEAALQEFEAPLLISETPSLQPEI
jgi:hypothetical protein